jgi:predicted permease
LLGATPGRVLRQLAVESLILAAVGAAAGVAVALVGIRALDVLVPAPLSGLAPLRIDARVLGFALALALATGVLFGLWPALDGRRAKAGDALRSGSAGAGTDGSTARLRQVFVIGEVAVALMLLVGSTLMLRSLHALLASESGVNAQGVATLELTLARSEYADSEGRRRFYERVLERLAGDPRVDAAAAINELPLRGVEGIQLLMYPEGRPPESAMDVPFSALLRITPDYFTAMGIRVLSGRAPLPRQDERAAEEVAISETLARLFWPGAPPLGEIIHWPGGEFEIVGVVADVRPTTLESGFIPQAYTSMMGSPDMNAALIVRGRAPPSELARILEDAVHEIEPAQAVYNVRAMGQVIAGAIQPRRTNTLLITCFGALALALALVGVYGVMAFNVSRRTREIGIRMALGARTVRVMRGVLREGLLLALIGTALGLAGAWALVRVMDGLVYGITTRDPLTFTLAPLAVLVFALVAALLPAWRAARVDPVEAIRAE